MESLFYNLYECCNSKGILSILLKLSSTFVPLSHYLQSTNLDFRNKAENAGDVQWRPGTEHFAPVMLEMPNAWGRAIFLDSCWQLF